MFFEHFASKNQLPGLSISGTLVENGLIQSLFYSQPVHFSEVPVLFILVIRGCSSDIASSDFFRPSKVTEQVTSRASVGEFKTK